MADKPGMANDGYGRPNLTEGYVRKGGQNPPPKNFNRPDPPPAFKPGSSSQAPASKPPPDKPRK